MTSPAPHPSEADSTPVARSGPLWGLALSGGGIRSATFCFGVVVALARHRQLLRFALMSTVSGGGFIGALIGKLFHDAGRGGADRVQAALAEADRRWFTWWLRANGNYLFARGARDVYAAASTMLRNLIALHLELALLALVLAGALSSVDLFGWWAVDRFWWDPAVLPGRGDAGQRTLSRLPVWLPTLWLLLPVFVFASGVAVCAYWALPRHANPRSAVEALLAFGAALGSAVVIAVFYEFLARPAGLGLPKALLLVAFAMSLLWVLGVPLAWVLIRGESGTANDIEDRLRGRLNTLSAQALRGGLIVAGAGALDRLAWFFAFELQQLLATGATLLLLATVLRAVLPKLAGSSGAAPAWLSQRLLLLAHVAGLALTLLLVAWWMALAYKQIFDIGFALADEGLNHVRSLSVAALLAGGALVFLVATGRNVAFANLSSLHRFYKARLVRGWLGAANADRMPPPEGSSGTDTTTTSDALDCRHAEPAEGYALRAEIEDIHIGDDVRWRNYAPQQGGGPLHLVNTCLNHSVRGHGLPMADGTRAGQAYNPDRKGHNLTLAPGGWLRIGARPWQAMPERLDALTLGSWTAISGAAFAPGLGSMTKSGIAALAMFAGVRLGFWWDTHALQPAVRGARWLIKSRLLLAELLGRFVGDRFRFWYLSDGGHFENTGAYALLRERTRLIVLADCGADPLYRFGDLENLVRLARVDLATKIHFLKPDPSFADARWRRFGSVSDLAAANSDACMALAEVTYPDDPEPAWLVLLKPNMFSGLSVDLINYRNANPDFPQQSTSDQSFGEPQWESYFALGREIGSQLDATLLDRIAAGEARGRFKPDDGRMLATVVTGKAGIGLRERLTHGAVGASIGLTTAVTLGVSTWQAIDAWRTSSSKANEADDKALKELSDHWGRLPPVPESGASASQGQAAQAKYASDVNALAASLLRIGDTLCPAGFNRWFPRAGEQPTTAQLALNHARQACQALPPTDAVRSPMACTRLLSIADPAHCLYVDTVDVERVPCPPRYWGRDYAEGNVEGNCKRSIAEPASTPEAVVATAAAPAAAPSPAPTATVPTADISVPPAAEPARAASVATSPASAPTAAEALGTVCTGKTVFVQVYGSSRTIDAQQLLAALYADPKSRPGIEDMIARSRLAKRSAPTPVRTDWVRWHTEADKACAIAIHAWLQARPRPDLPAPSVGPLAPHLKGRNGVVEVWLAPPKGWAPG